MPQEQPNKHVQLAQKHMKRGQTKRAITELEKALVADPSNIRVQLRLGELYLRQGSEDEAVESFILAGRSYENQGELQKALTVYEQVIRALPSRVELFVGLAGVYERLGLKEQAERQYKIALGVLDDLGDHHGKLDIIECVLSLGSGSVRDRIRLAELYLTARRTDDGVRQYRAAVDQLDKARAGGDLEVTRDFQTVAERYLYHQPEDADVSTRLAASYLDTQEAARALPRLRLAQRESPKDLEVLRLLALCFDQLGQDHKAVTVYKEMALLYDKHGLERERDGCYRKILQLNPTHQEAREALGHHQSDALGETIAFDSGPQQLKPSPPEPTVPPHEERLIPQEAPRPTIVRKRRHSSQSLEVVEDEGVGFADGGEEFTVVDPNFISGQLSGSLDNTEELEVTSVAPSGEENLPFEDELRELDFYIKNGFEEDARALLEDLQASHNNHPAIAQRAQAIAALDE